MSVGNYEPPNGLDPEYDAACDEIETIIQELRDYKEHLCTSVLPPSARSTWKYINTSPDSRDKYLIELPASMSVPDFFIVKSKRGKGAKQVNKYRSPIVADAVVRLEAALDKQTKSRTRGLEMIFARFDSRRPMWEAAIQASALLDALQSLAKTSSLPGFVRPNVLDCDVQGEPVFDVRQGKHPLVQETHTGGEFIPNSLTLGGKNERVLLLSGPNMVSYLQHFEVIELMKTREEKVHCYVKLV